MSALTGARHGAEQLGKEAATDAGPTTTLGAAAAGTSDATLARAAADAGPTTLAAAAAGTSDAQLARCPLWQQAQALSGVTPEQAAQIDEVNLYERLGETVLRRISTAFYERVYADRMPLGGAGGLLRDAFANTTKAEAASNQAAFLVERLGGPQLYTQRKGPFALIGRHAPYAGVTRDAAHRWLQHMHAALAAVPEVDDDSVRRLRAYFNYTAFFIVEGRALVNPNRLIGYGGSKHDGGV